MRIAVCVVSGKKGAVLKQMLGKLCPEQDPAFNMIAAAIKSIFGIEAKGKREA